MSDKFKRSNVFIALGAATGLGNAFRFPALCVSYGCSFLIAYALALALVCYPLLCAELALGRGKKGGRALKCVLAAACANSALIALYYGGISAKLGSACLNFAVFATAESYYSQIFLIFGSITALVAAYMLLNCKKKHLLRLNKTSVYSSFALFLFLAIFALATRPSSVAAAFSFDFSALKSVTVWGEALGQALLSLSLAAGVMPSFARDSGEKFSIKRTALLVIAANFSGCVLAMLATLPYVETFPASDALSCALTVYPQVVFAVAGGGAGARVLGTLVYAVLFIVAINSLCALASPLGEQIKKRYPLKFTLLAAVLLPAFLLGEGALGACDRMACSVTAIIIAFSESVLFAFDKSLKNKTGRIAAFAVKFFCPATCAFLTVFSLCGARFNFPPLSKGLAYCYLLAAVASAAVSLIRARPANGRGCLLRKLLQ